MLNLACKLKAHNESAFKGTDNSSQYINVVFQPYINLDPTIKSTK